MNRCGALFYSLMTLCMFGINNTILLFPDERPVFLREVNNNMYNVSPYFLGKVISDMPLNVGLPVVYGSIVYYSVGLNTAYWYKFPIFLIILVVCYNTASAYALFISCIIPDKSVVSNLTPLLLIPFMLFAGYFIS